MRRARTSSVCCRRHCAQQQLHLMRRSTAVPGYGKACVMMVRMKREKKTHTRFHLQHTKISINLKLTFNYRRRRERVRVREKKMRMIFPFVACLLQQPRAKPLGSCGIFAASCGVNCIGQNGWKTSHRKLPRVRRVRRVSVAIMKMNENR